MSTSANTTNFLQHRTGNLECLCSCATHSMIPVTGPADAIVGRAKRGVSLGTRMRKQFYAL